MKPTNISWTNYSSNPIAFISKKTKSYGWYCVKCSPGCAHCYSERINKEVGNGEDFLPGHLDNLDLVVSYKELVSYCRSQNKKTGLVFMCDMTDLFGEFISFETIDLVFASMWMAPYFTFQLLTKRALRMQTYINSDRINEINAAGELLFEEHWKPIKQENWPLANVWLGVTCESQPLFEERAPLLYQTKAVKRFISYEPAIGKLSPMSSPWYGALRSDEVPFDWIIFGGESGNGARPIKLEWLDILIRDCTDCGIKLFVKQMGTRFAKENNLKDHKGANKEEWDIKYRIQQMP